MTQTQQFVKWLLIIVASVIVVFIAFVIFAMVFFFSFLEPLHTKKDLIENYNKRQTQILELKRYFNSIIPNNKKVEIEFEDADVLSRFGVSDIDSATGKIKYPIFLDWDLNTASHKVDSIIRSLGWTQATLKAIKRKLDKAGCIQIRSGEPTQIGFQRSGMGMYYYNLFDNPIPDSLKSYYNDSCTFILYSRKLVLEYGGGAIGSQCFEKD